MYRRYLSILAGLLLLSACNDDDVTTLSKESEITYTTFNAWISDGADTRMQLTDGKHVTWQSNEKLGIFSDVQGITEYLITKGTNSDKATFTGKEVKGNTFYGFYPYDSNTSLDRDKHVVSFGFSPTVVVGNEGKDIPLPMIAKSTNNYMLFKQLSGIFHISLTGTDAISSVELKGNNGEQVGGMATVDYTSDSPVMKLTGESINGNATPTSLKTSFEKAYQLTDEPLDLYFVLPTQEYSKGITVSFKMEDGEVLTKNTSKSITLDKGNVMHFTTLDEEQLLIDKYGVTTSFSLGGELPSTTTDKNLYALIIYDKDGKEVAQGLFNDKSKMKLNLNGKKNYKVIATVIRDGKDLLYSEDSGYQQPLGTDSNATLIMNSFAPKDIQNGYTLEAELLGKGFSKMKDGNVYHYPATDRFYAEVDVVNLEQNSNVTLPMVSTSFGLRFEVTEVENGTLDVTFTTKDGKETLFSVKGITSAYNSDTKIFSYDNVRAAWEQANDYSEEIKVSVVWKKDSGVTKDLGSKTIPVKRNKVNIVSFKAVEDGSPMNIVMDDPDPLNESVNIHF